MDTASLQEILTTLQRLRVSSTRLGQPTATCASPASVTVEHDPRERPTCSTTDKPSRQSKSRMPHSQGWWRLRSRCAVLEGLVSKREREREREREENRREEEKEGGKRRLATSQRGESAAQNFEQISVDVTRNVDTVKQTETLKHLRDDGAHQPGGHLCDTVSQARKATAFTFVIRSVKARTDKATNRNGSASDASTVLEVTSCVRVQPHQGSTPRLHTTTGDHATSTQPLRPSSSSAPNSSRKYLIDASVRRALPARCSARKLAARQLPW